MQVNDLVTGDAVVLELQPAKLASRSVAFAIDVFLMVVAYVLLLTVLSNALFSVDSALAGTVALLIGIGVFIGYPVTLETLTRGRSVGKLVLGLRVVREDGGPIRFRQALTRGLAAFIVDFGVFSFFTGVVGLFTSLASQRGRRVGDMLAGTVVVRERVPVERAPDLYVPPPLAGWAAALELSGLSDALALSARQFVARAPQLDPQVRASLGHALAEQVAGYVRPGPPPGTPAEAFLVAVLAERRRRDGERLAARRPAQPYPAQPHPAPAPFHPPPVWSGPADPGAVSPRPEGFAPPR